MKHELYVIGMGPGREEKMTLEALQTLESCDTIVGYTVYVDLLKTRFPDVTLDYYQSNIEGELVDKLHAAQEAYDGVVMNAGAYTHTSIAIADAIGGIRIPVVEVHISCILAREEFRHVSLIAPKCKGSVMGFGLDSYRLGILGFLN